MIETILYALAALTGIALATGVAAIVAGFLAYWIAFVAALGWHAAAELHKH
jgi:hypothetical protein